MNLFVFRNNTVEQFFPKEYTFSGYEDISLLPHDCEGYVWWYMVPLKANHKALAEEVCSYVQKVNYVLEQVDNGKLFIALTMTVLYDATLTDDDHSLTVAVENYNSCLYELRSSYPNLRVIDITEFTRQYSMHELIDWKFYFMSQTGLNPKLRKAFKTWFERKIESVSLKRRKCLILDLDNTLWGGILGEDGADGIKIGGGYPGNAFSHWQQSLKQLKDSGILLTVCSKNNETDVLEVWDKTPFVILKKNDFCTWRINWKNKAENIIEIADELNIGLDSMVFIDDSPTERDAVRQLLPMVAVPDFPEQPYMLPDFFQKLLNDYFKVYKVTVEDQEKTEQYKANAARVRSQKSFADYDQFLKSLDIHIDIKPADAFCISRIAQMTQKTNQFNLTTKRYTETDIYNFINTGWRIWCISVSDRFGDYGIVGSIMIYAHEIDTLMFSCRILGKGIETASLKKVLELLYADGISSIKARYLPTSKNAQVQDFYERCGMTSTKRNNDGSKEYIIDISSVSLAIDPLYHITVYDNDTRTSI